MLHCGMVWHGVRSGLAPDRRIARVVRCVRGRCVGCGCQRDRSSRLPSIERSLLFIYGLALWMYHAARSTQHAPQVAGKKIGSSEELPGGLDILVAVKT